MTAAPFTLFAGWFAEAQATEPNDANAMALATVDADGSPSVRMVLMKDLAVDCSLTFHTNSRSRKGAALIANPRASALFHWKTIRRQVRFEGDIEDASMEDSDAYFSTRGRESQLSAWASLQSEPLDSRASLLARLAEMVKRFEGGAVPRPPHWRGFRIVPRRIEFWEDGDHRLHHRRLFTRDGDNWRESLLYP
jgi:pyridoxamine 5'-phosphate oxidase